MSDNKKYYYLKLKENFFDSDEMILLESMPDGYRYSNILLKMYLRSLKDEGRLMLSGKIPYSPEMLATVVRQPVGVVKEALGIFKELGLVSVLDTGAIYMMDIQNFIGKSSTEADRRRAYDKRIRAELKPPCEKSHEESHEESHEKSHEESHEESHEKSHEESHEKSHEKSTPEIEIEIEIEKEIEKELELETETESVSSLSEQRIAYAFCEAFGTETVSKRLLKTIRDTLQAGVSQERIEALIHSAKNKHPREPESYIAAGLKKLQASPQEQAVRFKPVSQLFEDWEEEWKREFEAMRQNMQA